MTDAQNVNTGTAAKAAEQKAATEAAEQAELEKKQAEVEAAL